MFVNCIFPAKYFAAFMIVTEADSVAASSMSLRMLWTDCECEHWHCEHTRQPPPRPAACWPVSGNTCASQPPLEGTLRHSLGVWIVENREVQGCLAVPRWWHTATVAVMVVQSYWGRLITLSAAPFSNVTAWRHTNVVTVWLMLLLVDWLA